MLEYKPLGLNKNTFPFMYMLQTIKLKLVFNNVSPAFAIEVRTKDNRQYHNLLTMLEFLLSFKRNHYKHTVTKRPIVLGVTIYQMASKEFEVLTITSIVVLSSNIAPKFLVPKCI